MPSLIRCAAALVVGVFAFVHPASAQTFRWDNGGSGTNFNWDNADNWFNITSGTNNEAPPLLGATVQFGTGYTGPITVNLNGNRFVESLQFGVPASTTLTGGSLTIGSGVITVYGNQFNGTDTTLPPNGPAVTAPVIINSDLFLTGTGVIDVRGSAELQTNGAISVASGGTGSGQVIRQGSGLWSIGGTANVFGRLTLDHNLSAATVATTRFGDVGNDLGGSLGINVSGTTNRIDWGVRNRLLFTGSAANQTLAKDIALVFASQNEQAIYSFETFNANGAVGPNASSLTLAGTISGDLTNNGAAVSNSFNFNVTSPTDPNFAVVLSGNNTFRATVTIQGGIVKLAHDNALGSPQTVVQIGSGATGAGAATGAALLVNAGRTISQHIDIFNVGGGIVYTVGGAPEFTSGLSTFTGGIALETRGVDLAAHGSSVVEFSGAITGTGGNLSFLGADLRKVGTGTVRLTAANSSVVADVEVLAGKLQLQGSGTLTASEGSATVFTGATLEWNNTDGTITQRINVNRAFYLRGGTLALVGGNATAGEANIQPGANSIVIDPNGGSSTFTLRGIPRSGPSSLLGGTLDFRTVNGAVLGNTARVTFTNSIPSLTNGIIGGWATVNGSDWATYVAGTGTGTGVVAYTNYTPFASATATSNAIIGDGSTTSAIAAVNSLKIVTTTPGSLNTGGTLTIGTGGILHLGGQAYSIANPISTGTSELAVTTDGTLTLNGPIATTSIGKSGSGTLVLGANVTLSGPSVLNANAGTIRFTSDNQLTGPMSRVYLYSPAAVGIDLNNTTQTLAFLEGTGNVAIGTGSLTIRTSASTGSNVTYLTGTISGSGALIKIGRETQGLSGNNPFTGSISILEGPLELTGANAAAGPILIQQDPSRMWSAGLTLQEGGTLAAPSTQPITIGLRGSLTLANNFDASVPHSNRTDRIADGRPIILAGGAISFTGHRLPYVSASETLGALTIQPGAASIRSSLSTSVATGGPAALTFTDVTRQVGSTVNFGNLNTTGGALGTLNGPRIYFTAGLTQQPSGFLPWATVNGTAFAYYGSDGVTTNTYGIQALSAAAQVAFNTAGAADHARLSGSGTLSENKTVFSLHIAPSVTSDSLNLGANNLTIASGGLLVNGNYSITGTGTLGSATTELILHLVGGSPAGAPPTVTIATPITGSAVTKSGTATLALTNNSTYSGPTRILAGWLVVSNPIESATSSATGTGPVTTFPGTVLLGGNATGTAGQITGPLTVQGDMAAGSATAPGIFTVRNDVTLNASARFAVAISGNAVGTQYGQLRVFDGDVTLNGVQFLPPTSIGTANAPLTIISVTNGTVSGVFNNFDGVPLLDGAVFANYNGVLWTIDYTPTSVILAPTPVPEPASVLGVCATVAGLYGLVRRRRRGKTELVA